MGRGCAADLSVMYSMKERMKGNEEQMAEEAEAEAEEEEEEEKEEYNGGSVTAVKFQKMVG